MHIMNTADAMSGIYSRSVSNIEAKQRFWVKDNVLYFYKKSIGPSICWVKNDWTSTYSKLHKPYMRMADSYETFIPIDDNSFITQVQEFIYLGSCPTGEMEKLWDGYLVGYSNELIYFATDTTLYASKIEEQDLQVVATFDELLACYPDAVVYSLDESIYQLYFENTNDPQLLTSMPIPWVEDYSFPLDLVYIYTSSYALQIGDHSIDMYIYDTGELKRIYEYKDREGVIAMAVVAGENEIFVSRQLMDIKFYKLDDVAVNGTWRYIIMSDQWKKINSKTYRALGQFDDQYLYGFEHGLNITLQQVKIEDN